MNDTLEKFEILGRYAEVLGRLCSSQYPLAITVGVETDDPLRIKAQDGKSLNQCAFVVREDDRWNGNIVVTVTLRDLQLEQTHIWSLSDWLRECGPYPANLLGEALLTSHLAEFEKFSAHIAPEVWERVCTNARHTRYGLVLLPEDYEGAASMRFQFHVSAILGAMNDRLKKAAEEGDQE